jgi:hypothetical protein
MNLPPKIVIGGAFSWLGAVLIGASVNGLAGAGVTTGIWLVIAGLICLISYIED